MQGDRASVLLAAGFSPDEVGTWATQQRQTLSSAGFSDDEINGYIGGQQPQVPQAFLDRMNRGTALGRILGKIGAGAAEGFGNPEAMSPETEQFWRDVGIFNDPAKGQASPIRTLNEAVAKPIAGAVALTGAAFNAATRAIGRGVEGIAAETGAPMPERLGAETTNFLNFLAADTMSRAPMVRVDRGPMGEVHDVPIGNLPEARSFYDATRAIVGPEPAPQVHATVEKLWSDHGIHPAEVAHDAAKDVTITQDLAGGGLPEAYVKPGQLIAEPERGAPATPQAPEVAPRALEAPASRPAEVTPLPAQQMIDDLPQTLETGSVDVKRFSQAPTSEQLDRLIELGKEHDAKEIDRVFGGDAELAKRLMRSSSEKAYNELEELTQKYGREAEGIVYGMHDHPIVNSEDLIDLRKSISNVEAAVDEAGVGDSEMLSRELSWIGRKLPEIDAAAHTTDERIAVLSLARAVEMMQERGIDIEPLLRRTVEYTAHRVGGDVGDTKLLLSRLSDFINRYAPQEARGMSPALSETGGGERIALSPPEQTQLSLLRRLAKSEEGALRLRPEEPPRTEAERAVLDRLSIGESDQGRPWSWGRMYTAIVDRLNPINEAVKQAGGAEKAAEDPYTLARLYAGVSGKADQFLQHGTYDFNTYANTGKPLREILAPVTDDLNGFRAYASSLRALELEKQGIKTGMDLGHAREVAQAGDTKYAPVMAGLVQYQNRLARYLRDSGVLSDEGFAAMTAKHQLYVPFQRVFGDVMGDVIPDVIRGQGKTLQASDPIHGIVGSERRVIDPLESIVRNTYLSIMMAERNAVGTKLIDLLQKAGDMPTPARTDTVSIYRNGVKETHQVSADLAAAMKGLDEESANTMLRLLGAPARMLRAGATLTPDFMARNLIRDFFGAVVNTTKGAFSPLDTAKGLIGAIRKDADFQEWLKGGGANSALVSLDRRYLQQNLAKLTEQTGLADRAWNVVRHPVDTLRAVSQLSEEATRLGEFKAARERELAAGATPKEAAQAAAYASREVTLDFARRGAYTRSMNMITAFWNAQVQGVDRLARAFKDDPAGTSLKIAAGVTVPSMLLWLANHDDPRWQEIPEWEKDLFWIVLTGTPEHGHIFRIPKPFETGVIFGSGVERLLDAFADQRPDAFRKFSSSIWNALQPGVIPTAGIPVLEQWANRSTFTDRPLIPQGQEKILPEYQYTPYTTETAKALGQIIGAFPGISEWKLSDNPAAGVARSLSTPILMENYVRAWTGGLGVYALQAADASLRKAGIVPDPPKPKDTLADIPVVKAFVVRYPSASAESIQRFYDDYDRNKRFMDTWSAKAKEGDIAAMQRVQALGGPRMFVQLDGIKRAMANNSKLVRLIEQNPGYSPSDKRQLIDTQYMRQIEMARAGLQVMRQADAALAAAGVH